jgi:hypothetical protein
MGHYDEARLPIVREVGSYDPQSLQGKGNDALVPCFYLALNAVEGSTSQFTPTFTTTC